MKDLLHPRQLGTRAIMWGIDHEPGAITAYIEHQHQNGHHGLIVTNVGFHISVKHPFLGASPDGGVYDPSCEQPYGFVEVKCTYSHRDKTPREACEDKGFFCALSTNDVTLKRQHRYFCQVQGQMLVGERPWCDFVVYTNKGITVERIKFDPEFCDRMLVKLVDFYDNCLAPEMVSPVQSLGLPIRDLRKKS